MEDIDALFRKHSVVELRQRLTRLKRDVESKKSELRLMVGDKYRDVIEASDSIAHMQDASQQLKALLDRAQRLCDPKALQDQLDTQKRQRTEGDEGNSH
jgi:hypothetical protein